MATEPTPDAARVYAKTLADLYADAVTTLLRAIAARADGGTLGQRAKLADLLALRQQARTIAARLGEESAATIAAIIGQAYDDGDGQAAEHLAAALGYRDAQADRFAADRLVATKRTTVETLARALTGTLTDLPIVRTVEDTYRSAIDAAVTPAAAGVETQRQALQRALDQLAVRGLGGVRDSAGRMWQVDTFADMATRSTLAQASLQGSVNRIRTVSPFVKVANSPDECDLCRPWEGAVLLTVAPSEVPEKWRDVPVDGTLRQATSAGLFHPNCTHALGAYIPGLTRTRDERPPRPNPQGYADRQRLRQLERNVREWKRRQAVAITPGAQAQAADKVRHWQQQIAAHVDTTGQARRRDREQLRTART